MPADRESRGNAPLMEVACEGDESSRLVDGPAEERAVATLTAAIETLTLPVQQLLSLRYCEGLTMREVAYVLSISPSWAYRIRRRTLAYLESQMRRCHL